MDKSATPSRRQFLHWCGTAAIAGLASSTWGETENAVAHEFALTRVKAFRIWSPFGQPPILRLTHWIPDATSGGTFDFEIMSSNTIVRDEGYLVHAASLGGGVAQGLMHAHFVAGATSSVIAAASNGAAPETPVIYRIEVLGADIPSGPEHWNTVGDIRWTFSLDGDKESAWFYGRNMNRRDAGDL